MRRRELKGEPTKDVRLPAFLHGEESVTTGYTRSGVTPNCPPKVLLPVESSALTQTSGITVQLLTYPTVLTVLT